MATQASLPSPFLRLVSASLLPVLLISSVPSWLLAQPAELLAPRERTVRPETAEAKERRGSVPQAPSSAPNRANRTLPLEATAESAYTRDLPENPTDEEVHFLGALVEPLLPAGGTQDENLALAKVLRAYAQAKKAEHFAPLAQFAQSHPNGRWTVGLWLNVGLLARQFGYFSQSLEAYEAAWKSGRTSPHAKSIVPLLNRAAAELAELNARLGRFERLGPLFQEVEKQKLDPSGRAGQLLTAAREGLQMMDYRPEDAFRCGPLALQRIKVDKDPDSKVPQVILAARSTRKGLSLDSVAKLSHEAGMPMRMARRKLGAPLVFPAVIHWKVGHYAAALEEKGDGVRVQDPTFGPEFWVSKKALDAECSGYFLIPATAPLPSGWIEVGSTEGGKVWGKGNISTYNLDCTGSGALSVRCRKGGRGMPDYDISTMLVGLTVSDTPIGYQPPRGPGIDYSLRYAHRDIYQGPWATNWDAYIIDHGQVVWNPNNTIAINYAGIPIKCYLPGGNVEQYSNPPRIGSHPRNLRLEPGVHYIANYYGELDELVQTSQNRYERRSYDGSKMIFDRPDSASLSNRRILLTKVIDRLGNTVTLSYNAQNKLVGIEDAIGQVTIISRSGSITEITDPWGRKARVEYDAAGLVSKIVDSAGLESGFTYQDSAFIKTMTTPYGTTRFEKDFGSSNTSGAAVKRFVKVTDPMGGIEAVQSWQLAAGISDHEAVVPTVSQGMAIDNTHLNDRNTFYWDKKAWKDSYNEATGVPLTSATVYHFMRDYDTTVSSGVLASIKIPNQSRIWFLYSTLPGSGQSQIQDQIRSGLSRQPSVVLQVVENPDNPNVPITKRTVTAYNVFDRPLSVKRTNGAIVFQAKYEIIPPPPAGDWAPALREYMTGMFPLEIYDGSGFVSKIQYNAKHQPTEITDASGQKTKFTYNTSGQLKTIENAKQEVTTWNYDPFGYLESIESPVSAAKVVYSYDEFRRVRAITSYPDNDTTYFDYDAVGGDALKTLDRPRKTTFPDGTFTEVFFDRLTVNCSRDRTGKLTYYEPNALGEIQSVIDPLGQVTKIDYCKCGALQVLTDGNTNPTEWTYDAQGRLKKKKYADSKEENFTYEPLSGRLSTKVDAKGQTTRWKYFVDGELKSVTFENALEPTAGTTYLYDSVGRLASVTRDNQAISYTYNPSLGLTQNPLPGAGRLATIEGTEGVQTFTHDELGRMSANTLNGLSRSRSWDQLGRLISSTNPLGTFSYNYDGWTGRVTSRTGAGPLLNLSYLDRSSSRRLQTSEFTSQTAPGEVYSRQTFEQYDEIGRIRTWRQLQGGTELRQDFTYDGAGQILTATQTPAGTTNPTRSRTFSFDAGGNRVGVQEGSTTFSAVATATNSLANHGVGNTLVTGAMTHGTAVSVNGRAATVTTDVSGAKRFAASVPTHSGTQALTVTASDSGMPTSRTRSYSVQIPGDGSQALFEYDANGNTTRWTNFAGRDRRFGWDAADRILWMTEGTRRTEFGYDPLGRRNRIVEKEDGIVVRERKFVYVGWNIAEEHDTSQGVTKLRRMFSGGEIRSGGADAGEYYYTLDHLGSVRELVDASGNVRARYEYDVWGERKKVAGNLDTDRGFTGYMIHTPSDLLITPTRIYAPELGRFLSRDPIGELGGTNLYGYVSGDPVNLVDPLRLIDVGEVFGHFGGAAIFAVGFAVAGAFLFAAAVGGSAIAAIGLGLLIAAGIAMTMLDIASSATGISMYTGRRLSCQERWNTAAGVAGGLAGGAGAGKVVPSLFSTRMSPKDLGNLVHYDSLNGSIGERLPTELANRFPETIFAFTERGAKGADVRIVGGRHPSEYLDSPWESTSLFGDFKPATHSSAKGFLREIIRGKLPENTQYIPYDPISGKLDWVP